MPQLFSIQNNHVLLQVKVLPRSLEDRIGQTFNFDDKHKAIKIYVKAIAQEGEANKALVSFLAKEWGLTQKQIEINRGSSSQLKLLKIYGLDPAIIEQYQDA